MSVREGERGEYKGEKQIKKNKDKINIHVHTNDSVQEYA